MQGSYLFGIMALGLGLYLVRVPIRAQKALIGGSVLTHR